MNSEPIVVPATSPLPTDPLRRICAIDYFLHLAGPLLSMGVLSVIALIINYIKREDAQGTLYESHMTWMIRTFWWTVFWTVITFIPALVLSLLSLGLLAFLFLIPVIWYLYRMVKGLLWLNEGRAMPV
jgi:uncharacterized membrane protein